MDFAVPADHRTKLKETKKKNKNFELLKKNVEHESDIYTKYNWYSWHSYQGINKVTGGLGNKGTSRDHPNYSITEIGQNTEKSP